MATDWQIAITSTKVNDDGTTRVTATITDGARTFKFDRTLPLGYTKAQFDVLLKESIAKLDITEDFKAIAPGPYVLEVPVPVPDPELDAARTYFQLARAAVEIETFVKANTAPQELLDEIAGLALKAYQRAFFPIP